jgi:hypothetical protein
LFLDPEVVAVRIRMYKSIFCLWFYISPHDIGAYVTPILAAVSPRVIFSCFYTVVIKKTP